MTKYMLDRICILLIIFAFLPNNQLTAQSILSDPVIVVCNNGSFTLNADTVFQGRFDSIRWQIKAPDAGNFVNIGDNSFRHASGETSNSLTLEAENNDFSGFETFDSSEIRFVRFDSLTLGSPREFSMNTVLVRIVSPPTPLANLSSDPADGTFCEGESIELSVSDGTMNGAFDKVVWSNIMDFSSILDEGNTILVSSGGTYYARREGCTTTEPVDISVIQKESPSPSFEIVANPPSLCKGSGTSVILTGQADQLGEQGKFVWATDNSFSNPLTGLTDTTISFGPDSTIKIFARIEAECGTTDIDSIIINVIDPPEITALSLSDTLICIGEEITFSATVSGGNDFSWDFGNNSDPEDGIGTGPFAVTYSQAGEVNISFIADPSSGCSSSKDTSINVLPSTDILVNGTMPDTIFTVDGSPLLLRPSLNVSGQKPLFQLDCSLGSLDPFSEMDTIFMPHWVLTGSTDSASTCCTLNVIESENCTNELEFKVIVTKLIDIPDVITPNGDGKNEKWMINFNDSDPEIKAEDFTIKLYNRFGKCVKGCDANLTVALFSTTGEVPDLELPDGSYFYVIENPSANFQRKGSLTILGN